MNFLTKRILFKYDVDCFERIRSGIRLHNSMIKFAVVTDSLIECELICLHIRHFTCRAFSYRYGIPSRDPKNTYNCLLSDHPIPEMDPGKHLIEESNCELYHRGSYGHGCEIDQWPYYPNPPGGPAIHAHIPSPTPYPSHHFPTSPPVIYPQQNPYPGGVIRTNMTDRPYTNNYLPTLPRTHPTYTPIIYHAVLPPENPKFPHNTYHGQIPHTKPHHPYNPYNSHYPYDHKPIRPPSVPNYHTQFYDPNLSKIPHFGRNDKICYTAYGTPARLTTSSIRNSIMVVSEQECKAECSKSRETSNFRCTTISYWLGHCELSDVEMRDLKPGIDFKEDESYWLFSWDFTDSRCFVPTTVTAKKPLDGPVFYPDGIWSTYTVSGRPCKAGTRCSVMPEVGVWSCPVEYGDWDYCCRPDHHCGYSEGYNYPWCYVGSKSREQWRPCSNLYYPYSQSQDKALHWPISYLHKISPPNNTYGYQTSLTDHFFSSVPKENTRRTEQFNTSSVVVSTSTSSNTTLLPIPSNATFSKLVEFQVVDVTENSKVTGNSIGEPWNWKMNVNISNKINNEVKWNESKLEANNNNNNNKNGITSLLNMRKRWSG